MGLLCERTAIITGGAGGIGRAIARRFHGEGAQVVICDICGDRLPEAVSQLPPSGERVHAVRADVTIESDIQRVVQETLERFRGIDSLRPLHPLGRNAKPKDIADVALFLASDQSRYVTGVLLNVDGGRHMATNRPPAA